MVTRPVICEGVCDYLGLPRPLITGFSPSPDSGSSGGSGGRENSGGSAVGVPLAVPTPSPPSMGQGESRACLPVRSPSPGVKPSPSPAVATSSASVPQGPGLGPIPMSQFGTISRQISRHSSSSASSASMVSATGTYRRAPSVSSQQPHVNGGPAYTQNSGLLIINECFAKARDGRVKAGRGV